MILDMRIIGEENAYLGRVAAFSLILRMKRPLWKLRPATSASNFSNGYESLVRFPSLKRPYPCTLWASISLTQSETKSKHRLRIETKQIYRSLKIYIYIYISSIDHNPEIQAYLEDLIQSISGTLLVGEAHQRFGPAPISPFRSNELSFHPAISTKIWFFWVKISSSDQYLFFNHQNFMLINQALTRKHLRETSKTDWQWHILLKNSQDETLITWIVFL